MSRNIFLSYAQSTWLGWVPSTHGKAVVNDTISKVCDLISVYGYAAAALDLSAAIGETRIARVLSQSITASKCAMTCVAHIQPVSRMQCPQVPSERIIAGRVLAIIDIFIDTVISHD